MGAPSSIEVTVIIPVYNDAERLTLCLQALENQTFPGDAYEVLVIDNHSTEPVAPIVAAFPHVRCLFEGRRGSYAARNLGLTQARGDILAFTDSDCIPNTDWIERGVAALRQDKAIGLIGGRIILFSRDPDHPTAAELFELMGAFQQQAYVEQKHYGATANVFTSRRVLDQVGVFDGSLPSGGDRQWGQRVFDAGYRQVYADDVVVRHPARRSLAELRVKAARLSEGRYRVRKSQARNSLSRILIDILGSIVPPKQTIRVYLNRDLHGFGQKTKVICVMLYMFYFYVSQNLRHLWQARRNWRSRA